MFHLITLAALGLTGPAAAPPPPPPQEAQAETPTARFARLEAAAQAAQEAWRERLSELRKAAADGGPPVPEEAWTSPLIEFVPSFAAGARDHAGTADAVPFLVWLASNAVHLPEPSGEVGKGALRELLSNHAAAPELAEVTMLLGRLGSYFGAEQARELLARVEEATPSATVRGWAVYARLTPTLDGAAVDSEEFLAAKAELLAALEGVEDSWLKTEAGNKIEVRERFSIGMVAPDIQGVDLDGTAFRLSDYKGKVLFVDFWGDW